MAATAMSYHMMVMQGSSAESSSNSTMTMMDHSHHGMMMDSSGDSPENTEDCCLQICNCFTGGCSTVAALIEHSYQSPIHSTYKIHTYLQQLTSHQVSSLYRPPILS
ncbi:hypothetical protein SAMN05216262_10793 [Colwellia chukchiensis]|uniref:Uncharacterized protein n=2 Tax=Colwellia chukchiensis TaxID=641665 RepID=A0A1H7NBT3_9GAMM|nr:hypothetical protein SAMN05216262_10793 [Colwellia chukchiensis]